MTSPSRPLDPAETALHRQYLRLTIGGESYLVPIDCVREILEITRMTPLPLAPDFVHGVMNLRGAVVPVIDLNARFGRGPTTLGRRSCIVVIETAEAGCGTPRPIGALVDGVSEVLDVAAGDIEPVPPLGTRIPPEFIHGMARARGDIYAVIELSHTLGEEQMGELIAAQASHPGAPEPWAPAAAPLPSPGLTAAGAATV